jgi:hypothetical protein
VHVAIDHRSGVTTAITAVAIALSSLLLVLAVVGGNAPDDAGGSTTPDVGLADAGPVNPWAAGDAAALLTLADLGRGHLDACP